VPSFSLRIILLAGGGSRRMLSDRSKVLHTLGGRPVLAYALHQALTLDPSEITVVASPALKKDPLFFSLLPPQIQVALQEEPQGTGNAVAVALKSFPLKSAPCPLVLVLFGDTPLLTPKTLQAFLDHHQKSASDLSILGITPPSPFGYGRLIVDSHKRLTAIVEEKDADEKTRSLPLCNGGVMLLGESVLPLLSHLEKRNKADEYYLTDLVALAHSAGKKCTFLEAPFEEVMGINTRSDLSQAENYLQNLWREKALSEGVSLIDPQSVYFSFDTKLSQDVTLFPHVFLGPGVVLHEGVTVLPFCVLEEVEIKKDSRVGPFCHLRSQTVLEEGVCVGNFVEIKKSTLGARVNAKHLSYLGDAILGAGANVGAGTITCNYDGKNKHKTLIGKNAFVGSQTALIAPVSVGESAIIAAGSVITEDVPAHHLGISRSPQKNLSRPSKASQNTSSP
jgi:bifunctional UDP-N-acetylglucosamine pyrophosphorylase/glucosamine-1-phosphate N-acetyltransferase